MFEDEAQPALRKDSTESGAKEIGPEVESLALPGDTASPKPSGEALEGEYVEPQEEIDPYISNVKRLHPAGDRETLMKYMRSSESEQDFGEHMEIVGDRSMMEALNHNAKERGEAAPFDEEKMKTILKRDHEIRTTAENTGQEDKYVERDSKRLSELRRSLGLPSRSTETHLLGPAESEQ